MTDRNKASERSNQPRTLSLRANFSWTLFGSTYYHACQWGMLAAIARLGTQEMVGTYALALAVTAPVFMFTNLQLRAVQATDARAEYQFGDYLALRYLGIAVAILTIFAILVVAHYDAATAVIVALVATAKGVESVSDVIFGLFQKHEDMRKVSVSWVLKGTLSLAATVGLLSATGSLALAVGGLVVTWLVILVAYDVRTASAFCATAPRFHTSTLLRLAKVSAPLGAVMMLISLNTNIPRYFLEAHAGRADLGVFAALSYLMVAGTTVINSLGASASPRLAKYYATGNRGAFANLIARLLGLGLTLGLAGGVTAYLVGDWILVLTYGPEYGPHKGVLVMVMIASAVGYLATFCGYGLTAARFFKIQMPVFTGVAATTTLASTLLVPAWGISGAAAALILASAVQLASSMLALALAILSDRQHTPVEVAQVG